MTSTVVTNSVRGRAFSEKIFNDFQYYTGIRTYTEMAKLIGCHGTTMKRLRNAVCNLTNEQAEAIYKSFVLNIDPRFDKEQRDSACSHLASLLVQTMVMQRGMEDYVTLLPSRFRGFDKPEDVVNAAKQEAT